MKKVEIRLESMTFVNVSLLRPKQDATHYDDDVSDNLSAYKVNSNKLVIPYTMCTSNTLNA